MAAFTGDCVIAAAGIARPGGCIGAFVGRPSAAELIAAPIARGGRPHPGAGVLGALGRRPISPRSTGTWGRSGSSPGSRVGASGARSCGRCARGSTRATRLAWLETDKERNVRFYSGLGFEVAANTAILGVETWYMRRDPRP